MEDVILELTGQCPNFCGFCSSGDGDGEKFYLSADKVKDIIDDLASIGVDGVCFSGGEPFVYSSSSKKGSLENIVKYADGVLDSKLTAYTSGFEGYEEKISKERLSGLSNDGLDRIVFSFHGPGNNLKVKDLNQQGNPLSEGITKPEPSFLTAFTITFFPVEMLVRMSFTIRPMTWSRL